MKKAGLFIASILLISIFSFFVYAQEPPIPEVPLVKEIQTGQQQFEQFTTEQNKSEYLKQEWAKLLEKNKYLGPVFSFLNKIFVFLDPFFKIVLGVESSSLSWALIFAIIIWLTLFFFLNPITSQLFNNGLFGGIAAFAIASLIGLAGIIRGAVNLLTLMISNIWIAIISLIIGILFIVLFERLGRTIKAKIKKAKESEEARKTAEAQKITQTAGEVEKKYLESYSEHGGGD